MATKQIVTCDGCEREETSMPADWMKANVPAGFLSGNLKERASTAADLCPTCVDRAASVFAGYRRLTGSARASSLKATVATSDKSQPQAASSDRSAHGSRYAAVLNLLRTGAKTQAMLIDDLRSQGYAKPMITHTSEVIARLIKRGVVRCKNQQGTMWYSAPISAVRKAEKEGLLGGKLRGTTSARRGAPTASASNKMPEPISDRIMELLKTGPATTEELSAVLGVGNCRKVNGALQFLRKRQYVTTHQRDGGRVAWGLTGA